VLVWEIIGPNLPADVLQHWPWRLRIFDLQSGATIVTVLCFREEHRARTEPAA
jgi:hypothetical protein